MSYNVYGGTLSFTQSINQSALSMCLCGYWFCWEDGISIPIASPPSLLTNTNNNNSHHRHKIRRRNTVRVSVHSAFYEAQRLIVYCCWNLSFLTAKPRHSHPPTERWTIHGSQTKPPAMSCSHVHWPDLLMHAYSFRYWCCSHLVMKAFTQWIKLPLLWNYIFFASACLYIDSCHILHLYIVQSPMHENVLLFSGCCKCEKYCT